jgi:hypothetical protein
MAESFPEIEDPCYRPVSANPTSEEARAYELLVRDLLRVGLMGPDAIPDPSLKTYRSVELSGQHPDTELVIGFDDSVGRRREETFALWDEDTFSYGPGTREPPNGVVGIIVANLLAA